jgi:hypothetical protein
MSRREDARRKMEWKKQRAIKREELMEEGNRRGGNARGAFYSFLRMERVNRFERY